MEKVREVHKAIEVHSLKFEKDTDYLTRELKSAKNFISTPDLKHWTFGKSVGRDGDYHSHGNGAKKRLRELGFKNIYELDKNHENVIRDIENSFYIWADRIGKLFLIEKLKNRDKANKPFELYVYKDVLDGLLAVSTENGLQTIHEKEHETQSLSQALFDEGHEKEISVEIRARNSKLVEEAKKVHGTTCKVCEFNFGQFYGELGEGFIEMHHLYPISKGKRVSSVHDLIPVCANCHRMLHKGGELMQTEELISILKEHRMNQ